MFIIQDITKLKCVIDGWKEENVSFTVIISDIWLSTIWILRGNPLLFPISSKGLVYACPTNWIVHTMAFVTPVVEH